MTTSKHRRISNKWRFLAVILMLVVLILIGVFVAIIRAADEVGHSITDTAVIYNSKKLYSRPLLTELLPGPGNDTYLKAMYKVSHNGTASALSDNSTVLKDCLHLQAHCTRNPTWRPRQQLVANDGHLSFNYADVTNKQLRGQYKALSEAADTECTAIDITYGQPSATVKPNDRIVCVNSRLDLLTYEYLSQTDSVKF